MQLTVLRSDPLYATANLVLNTIVVGMVWWVDSCSITITSIPAGVIPIIVLAIINYQIVQTMKKNTQAHNKICSSQR